VIYPIRDKIIVQPVEAKTVSAGGIHIPDSAAKTDNYSKGVILSVGPGRTLDSGALVTPSVAAGQQILFNLMTAIPVKANGQQLFVLTENDILAVLED